MEHQGRRVFPSLMDILDSNRTALKPRLWMLCNGVYQNPIQFWGRQIRHRSFYSAPNGVNNFTHTAPMERGNKERLRLV